MEYLAVNPLYEFMREELDQSYYVGRDSGAVDAFGNLLESHATHLILDAATRATDAGRVTIQAEDLLVNQPPTPDRTTFPAAQLESLIRDAFKQHESDKLQLSTEALRTLDSILSEFARHILPQIILLTEHADRVTIRPEDIELYQQLFPAGQA